MKERALLKLDKLKDILKEMDSLLVAFSGGVDSTFLLFVAKEVLSDNVAAFTAVSETYTDEELKFAREFCTRHNIKHFVERTCELEKSDFTANPPDRCFYCKSELFGRMREVADEHRFNVIADATNVDDLNDYRPGRRAAENMMVRSPLVEAGLTKREIRYLSQFLGVEGWDRPAGACLASRFAYGEEITPEKLNRVEEAEKFLKEMGFTLLRVRYHPGDHARIEVAPDEVSKFFDVELRRKVADYFYSLGFKYVSLDLEGYASGSMNRLLRGKKDENV